jgi:hypothetical protein
MLSEYFQRSPSIQFLGAFVKLRKASNGFVMSLCPSVRVGELCSHWTDFHKICYLNIFRKSVKTIQVSLKSGDHYTCMLKLRSVLLGMKNVLDKVVEKIKTHVL